MPVHFVPSKWRVCSRAWEQAAAKSELAEMAPLGDAFSHGHPFPPHFALFPSKGWGTVRFRHAHSVITWWFSKWKWSTYIGQDWHWGVLETFAKTAAVHRGTWAVQGPIFLWFWFFGFYLGVFLVFLYWYVISFAICLSGREWRSAFRKQTQQTFPPFLV